MVICCIRGCSQKSETPGVKLFAVPSVRLRGCDKSRSLSETRRRLWLQRINRKELPNAARACNLHFAQGFPADLMDELHPDWAPSLNLGHQSCVAVNSKRYDRHLTRRAPLAEVNPNVDLNVENLNVENLSVDIEESDEAEKSDHVSCQTDITSDVMDKLEKRAQTYTLSYFEGNDRKVRFYFGLPDYITMFSVFELVSQFIYHSSKNALSLFQEFVLVMMRLRLNLLEDDLADRFDISQGTVSKILDKWIPVMAKCLEGLIVWPSRETLLRSTPECFRKSFGSHVVVIIDCFEVFIQRPSDLLARAQTWSDYKHHNTLKYLIGVTPQGTISFISRGWGGRSSDKYITESKDCKFLDMLLPGDVILADRGFTITDSVLQLQAQIIMPSFMNGRSQLSTHDVVTSNEISNVRIHVERVIGLLKRKFLFFSRPLYTALMQTSKMEAETRIDNIVKICCALVNLCPPIVPMSDTVDDE
ncbi:Protein ALP1-like [Frankliniella fusca]|uniref:Protein ALP1-like n=1 Tax=Frankliniella fusca TaxID=407009 RepID=A0AAE1HIR4_9NEOP|nr:Protein ALP1-like [Frankliniella fusca]